MIFILDTNVISEIMQPKLNDSVATWFTSHKAAEFFTTVISQAEIYAGVALLPTGKKKQALHAAAQLVFENEFANRIYSFDSVAALENASIKAKRTKLGLPISFQDLCIAAIAKTKNAVVVTRDVRGFVETGAAVVNPWE